MAIGKLKQVGVFCFVASLPVWFTGCPDWVSGNSTQGTVSILSPGPSYTYYSGSGAVQQLAEADPPAKGIAIQVESLTFPEDVEDWDTGPDTTQTYATFEKYFTPPYTSDFITGAGAYYTTDTYGNLVYEEATPVEWDWVQTGSKPAATARNSMGTVSISRYATIEELKVALSKLRPGYVQRLVARYEKAKRRVGATLVNELIRQRHPNLSHGDIAAAIEFAKNPNRETNASATLGRNFPDPFNPETTIPYMIGGVGATPVALDIYNTNGQLVKSLVNEIKPPGSYVATWNGQDNLGRSVASGVYFYRMELQGSTYSQKMVLLK